MREIARPVGPTSYGKAPLQVEAARRLEALTAEVGRLQNWNALRGQDIIMLGQEVGRLHARLEDDHVFQFDADGNMVRVEVEPGSIPDGIECRDETIKLQDAKHRPTACRERPAARPSRPRDRGRRKHLG